jgi:multidrug efflux pump subunit AcrA (membrane-fusion protein)
VVNDDKRLEMRKVTVKFSQQGYAVLKKGLKPGERIITSDLITALDGMLLAPQKDKKTKSRMVAQATGKPGKEPNK